MEILLSQPKQTFLNLTAEKRASIEAVLVEEFATKGYQKASLNAIVKELNIAKGSLYQYFENKEAIFLYVFDCFTRLVKKSVGAAVDSEQPWEGDFWHAAHEVMLAGIRFIERYPFYFQLYLQVLHEENIPHRELLLERVRLFSKEYFGPMIEAYQEKGVFVQTPAATIIFIIDAVMDRFFQGYARQYLDGGLDLNQKKIADIELEIKQILTTLKFGFSARK
nr:TetR/AcrR family transcriptional regulator [Desulfobulbaceae bacterium]